MDYDYVGKATSTLGIWLIRSNREKASGGPFFRSLVRGCSPIAEDLYEILYYNMGTTDPQRWGLQGPYVLSFTDGGAPNSALFSRNVDWSWMDTLGIKGWVPTSGRGSVAGVGIKNMKAGYTYVVGLSNTDAQYWGTANPTTGAFSIAKILPGTYTLTIYKGEIEVHTSSVVITAGGKIALNSITPTDPSDTVSIWRIGKMHWNFQKIKANVAQASGTGLQQGSRTSTRLPCCQHTCTLATNEYRHGPHQIIS